MASTGHVQAGAVLLAVMALVALAAGSQAPDASQEPVAPRPRPLLRGRAGGITTQEAEGDLVAELAGNASSQRLLELETALRPMYAALPKEAGYLGYQAVRYALHRLLLQRHGWFVVGLEPTDEALPPYLNGEWVPEYLQGMLEQRLGGRGINLHEIAALAASVEDLVRGESDRRMDFVYELLGFPPTARLGNGEADRALETYMMMYADNGNFTASGNDPDVELATFKAEFDNWDSAAHWIRQIKEGHLDKTSEGYEDGKLGRADLAGIANELGQRYGSFNDGECRGLKRELLTLEGRRPGRIPLLDFYKKGLVSHWEFNERVDYLKAIGALDESDVAHPSVILPNYLGSRTNCLAASHLYAVCCRNECEDLMGHLEHEIAGPTASPQQIRALVGQLASDTVNSSRELPDQLVQRLHQIATRHGGQVPLHGRLFAQWMHHAYPRECPFPHESGVNPLTPDEWMREAGGVAAKVSEQEAQALLGLCAAGGADGDLPCGSAGAEEPAELPWSDAEVLLTGGRALAQAPLMEAKVAAAGICLPVALLPLLGLCLSGLAGSSGGSAGAVCETRCREQGRDDLEDWRLQKLDRGPQRWQQCAVLLGLAVVGFLLEFLGVLDHFSFACTMAVGLVLNVAAPLLLRRAAPAGLAGCSGCA